MKTLSSKLRIFTVLGMAAVLAAGCVERRVVVARSAPYGETVVVAEPPPPPQVEVVPVAPGPDYVWVDGYWAWRSHRWAWESGRFEHRPHPRASWSPGRWERHRYGYSWVPGRWR